MRCSTIPGCLPALPAGCTCRWHTSPARSSDSVVPRRRPQCALHRSRRCRSRAAAPSRSSARNLARLASYRTADAPKRCAAPNQCAPGDSRRRVRQVASAMGGTLLALRRQLEAAKWNRLSISIIAMIHELVIVWPRN